MTRPAPDPPPLRIYLEGLLEFEDALAFQQELVAQVAEGRDAALLLCEHDGTITVGRDGGPADIRCDRGELLARRWAVRWVNRAGGSVLHLPGQLAIYPVLPLDRLGLDVGEYVVALRGVLARVLDDFGVPAGAQSGSADIWANGRPVASLGVAVRDWVSYFGAVLNIDPDLPSLELVHGGMPMTSLARERRGPVRVALVRQRLIEHFTAALGFDAPQVFFGRPRPARPTGATA